MKSFAAHKLGQGPIYDWLGTRECTSGCRKRSGQTKVTATVMLVEAQPTAGGDDIVGGAEDPVDSQESKTKNSAWFGALWGRTTCQISLIALQRYPLIRTLTVELSDRKDTEPWPLCCSMSQDFGIHSCPRTPQRTARELTPLETLGCVAPCFVLTFGAIFYYPTEWRNFMTRYVSLRC